MNNSMTRVQECALAVIAISVVAIAIGAVTLGEQVTVWLGLGAALVGAGVAMAQ